MTLGHFDRYEVAQHEAFDLAANGGFGIVRDPRVLRTAYSGGDAAMCNAIAGFLMHATRDRPVPVRVYLWMSSDVTARLQGDVVLATPDTIEFVGGGLVELDYEVVLAVYL